MPLLWNEAVRIANVCCQAVSGIVFDRDDTVQQLETFFHRHRRRLNLLPKCSGRIGSTANQDDSIASRQEELLEVTVECLEVVRIIKDEEPRFDDSISLWRILRR